MLLLLTRCSYYIVRETCLMAYHVFWREPLCSLESLCSGLGCCSSECPDLDYPDSCTIVAGNAGVQVNIPHSDKSNNEAQSSGKRGRGVFNDGGSQTASRKPSTSHLFLRESPNNSFPPSSVVSSSTLQHKDQAVDAKPKRKNQQTNTESQTTNAAGMTRQTFANTVEKQDAASRTDLNETYPKRSSYAQASTKTKDAASSASLNPSRKAETASTTGAKQNKFLMSQGTNTPVGTGQTSPTGRASSQADTTADPDQISAPHTGTTSQVGTGAEKSPSMLESELSNGVDSELKESENTTPRNPHNRLGRAGSSRLNTPTDESSQSCDGKWYDTLPSNFKDWAWLMAYAALFLFLVLHLIFLAYHYKTIQRIRQGNSLEESGNLVGSGDASLSKGQTSNGGLTSHSAAGFTDPQNASEIGQRQDENCDKCNRKHKTYNYYDCMHNHEKDGSSFQECLHIA